jgi:hypothetical protein
MSLNLLPPEICSQIFAFACTDGGYTGRALSAMSQNIREISGPYKFQSIALHNAHQTSSFASILSRTPPHLCGVTHLFVSNDDFILDETEFHSGGTMRNSSRRRISSILSDLVTNLAKHLPKSVKPIKDHDRDIIEALLKILRIIAPTLRTLSISFECRWIYMPLLDSNGTSFPDLPSLTELSVNYRAPTDALFNHYILHFPVSFPSLRRLDISGIKLLSYRFHLFGCIKRIAPCLTHLHLPARMALMNVPFGLPAFWLPINHGAEDDNFSVTLDRVLIQLNGPHMDRHHNPRHGGVGCTRCRLLAMVIADGRFVALEARSDDTWQKSRERLEDEWMDRINDGEGGWDEANAVDESFDG